MYVVLFVEKHLLFYLTTQIYPLILLLIYLSRQTFVSISQISEKQLHKRFLELFFE